MRPGKTTRAAWAAAAGVSCVLAPLALVFHHQRAAAEDISECVEFSQSVRDDGMRLRLASSCDSALTCNLTWTLRCEGGRERREGAAFALEPGGSYAVRASAASCRGAGWSIHDISWRCRSR